MPSEKEYLLELENILNRYASELRLLDEKGNYHAEMHQLLEQAVALEKDLRDYHQVGVRFNVVRQQLQKLLAEVEIQMHAAQVEQQSSHIEENLSREPLADEKLIYVYLFNMQGRELANWQALLTRKALIEHSVNRPIYTEKYHVEESLRSKSPKEQHAYLEIIVKNDDIIHVEGLKDILQHPIVRLRQGAIKIENVQHFFHNDKTYRLDQNAKLVLI